MSYSQVSISNLALATIGEASIRDFNENNIRARMCQNFFGPTRDYLLAKFDWPFARAYKKLSEKVLPEDQQLDGRFAYGIPDDCRTVRGLESRSGRESWEVIGDYIITPQPIVGIFYTKQEIQVNRYSDPFVNLLALGMAVRLAPALTKDRNLTNSLFNQYKAEQNEAWESEANVGNTYRSRDNDPNLDTFTNVDMIRPHGYLSSN